MNAKPYKVIFTLLILSVLFVLIVQGFWIRNFYVQKQDEFSKTIYSALEKITTKLRERQSLRVMQEKLSYEPSFRVQPSLSGKPPADKLYIQVRSDKKGSSEITVQNVSDLKKGMKEVTVKDSSVKIITSGKKIITKTSVNQSEVSVTELDQLMDKMITEIRIIDTDERNGDTLKNIIKRAFANKGLFLPFEFALKKVFKNVEETLAKSAGYDDKATSFISDLSANDVFSTHNFLFVQFPNSSNYVLLSIKKMLLLSLVFSLIMIAVFYYTIRLILSQKKLSEIKNDFVNNMTHELKTPIATNSLAIDAISNPLIKNDEEKFKDYIRILKEENQKLNVHVERVLQMALLDKGDLPLNKRSVDLVSIINLAIENYKLQISEQKTDLHFNPPPGNFIIDGDEQHLLTVFSNLLDNALKYSNNKCRIEIELIKNGEDIFVFFKDNGIGIDKEHREKVFDKFYRVQGGNLHDVKGFGLGLSYVRSIVEAHGGSIELNPYGSLNGCEFIIKFKADRE